MKKLACQEPQAMLNTQVENRCCEFLSQVGTLDDGVWEKLAFRLLNISYIGVHVHIYVCIHVYVQASVTS